MLLSARVIGSANKEQKSMDEEQRKDHQEGSLPMGKPVTGWYPFLTGTNPLRVRVRVSPLVPTGLPVQQPSARPDRLSP